MILGLSHVIVPSANITGQETDFHRIINGFHFIGVSASPIEGEHYDENQKKWLVEQLDAAVADETFTILMGEEVEPRRQFIEEHAKTVINLDI